MQKNHPTPLSAVASVAYLLSGHVKSVTATDATYAFDQSSQIAIVTSYAKPDQVTTSVPNEKSEEETAFLSLVKEWRDETLFYSSLTDMCFHPAYQTIMAMGKTALPFIFKEMARQADHWFYALKFIVRDEPVAKGASNLEEARQLWLKWARKKKYIA